MSFTILEEDETTKPGKPNNNNNNNKKEGQILTNECRYEGNTFLKILGTNTPKKVGGKLLTCSRESTTVWEMILTLDVNVG